MSGPFSNRSPEIFRSLIEMSRDPFYVLDPAQGFRLAYANPAAIEHWGWPAEELYRMSVPDWDPNWTVEELQSMWRSFDPRTASKRKPKRSTRPYAPASSSWRPRTVTASVSLPRTRPCRKCTTAFWRL